MTNHQNNKIDEILLQCRILKTLIKSMENKQKVKQDLAHIANTTINITKRKYHFGEHRNIKWFVDECHNDRWNNRPFSCYILLSNQELIAKWNIFEIWADLEKPHIESAYKGINFLKTADYFHDHFFGAEDTNFETDEKYFVLGWDFRRPEDENITEQFVRKNIKDVINEIINYQTPEEMKEESAAEPEKKGGLNGKQEAE